MKDSWERIELPPSLDSKQINEIVKPAFPNKRVVYSERIGVGLSNSNYKSFLMTPLNPLFFAYIEVTRRLQKKNWTSQV